MKCSRDIKILHFVSHFSLLSETFIYDEINALAKAFPKSNTILTLERHLEKERPFRRVNVVNKTPTFRQNLHRRYLKRVKKIQIPSENFPLYSYLAWHLDAFDLIHVHFAWNVLTLVQGLKRLGWERRKPIFVQCHGSDITSAPLLDAEYKKQLLEIAGFENVFFSAHSEFLREKMVSLGISPARIYQVANTFNRAFLNHRKQSFFQRGDCFRLINTARFVGWKGQSYLVEAFARFVREVYANSELTLIGDGETLPLVKQLADRERVSDKIRFLGSVPHHEIAAHLVRNDLYVQPSIRDPKTFQEESFGVVLLEALAVGLPLVITRTGGMPEIVGEQNPFARIVPDRDAGAMFGALKEMFESGNCFRDTLEFSRKRLDAFMPERQMENLQSAYSRILQGCQLSVRV